MPAFPLNIREEDISKSHILSLFSPSPEMAGRSRVLNTMHYVLSQLSDPFDLQSRFTRISTTYISPSAGFIELVEQEKWEDEAATFIAFRQTLLTRLISLDDNDFYTIASESGSIVLDLTDTVLASAGVTDALALMAIDSFLARSIRREKLLSTFQRSENEAAQLE